MSLGILNTLAAIGIGFLIISLLYFPVKALFGDGIKFIDIDNEAKEKKYEKLFNAYSKLAICYADLVVEYSKLKNKEEK